MTSVLRKKSEKHPPLHSSIKMSLNKPKQEVKDLYNENFKTLKKLRKTSVLISFLFFVFLFF